MGWLKRWEAFVLRFWVSAHMAWRTARLHWALHAPDSPCDTCLTPTGDAIVVVEAEAQRVVRRCQRCQTAAVVVELERAMTDFFGRPAPRSDDE